MFRKKTILTVSLFLLCVGPAGSALAQELDPNMVGWWKFDDARGSVATDSSGNGYDGAVVGATWKPGQLGAALAFGSGAYVDVPAEAWSTVDTQVTAAFWAYGDPDAQPQANFIFGAFTNPADNNARVMSAHVPWSNGTVYFDTSGREGAWDVDRINRAADAADYEGTWTHWAFVKNVETGDQQIYLNGVLWHSGTGMTKPMTGADVTAFTIGCAPRLTEFYVGSIDDFRLYDRALSEQELQVVMEGADTVYPSAIGIHPKNGAIDVDTTLLEWKPGDTAVAHNVYLGTDPDAMDLIAEGDGAASQAAVTLEPGLTYYWRVDAIDAEGVVFEGDLWSFGTLPLEAHFPNPYDGQENVLTDTQLSWTAGKAVMLHNVYFGTDPGALTPNMFLQDTTFDPGPLEAGTTYYWRVDEFTGVATNEGPLWSFSTVPEVPMTDDPNLIAWFKLDEGGHTTAVDSSGYGNHGTLVNGPLYSDGVIGPALVFDGQNDYVNVVLDVPENGGAAAFWFKTVNPNCGLYAVVQNPLGGGGYDRMIYLTGGNIGVRIWDTEVITTAGLDVADGCWHHLAHTYGDAVGGQKLYVDGVLQAYGIKAESNFDWQERVNIGWSADAAQDFFEGLIDDVRIYDRTLGPDEIEQLVAEAALAPCGPEPIPQVIVEDFESYNDTDNLIFETWLADGGAMVGNAEPPYAQFQSRHSGAQAMPLAYDNTDAGFSEATLSFDGPQDMTGNELNTLSLWYRGRNLGQDSLTYDATSDTYTMTSWHSGDVWGGYDTMHYAFQEVSGDCEIIVKIESLQNLETGEVLPQWVRSGVMIRDSIDPGSRHVGLCLESFQQMVWGLYRAETGGGSEAPDATHRGPTGVSEAPIWLKLTRTGRVFRMSHSLDAVTWESIRDPNAEATETEVELNENVLIGLVLNSSNLNQSAQMVVSNVTVNGAPPTFVSAAIGDAFNAREQLYVAVEDAAGNTAVALHPDGPEAVGATDWTEWLIPLAAFADGGADLSAVTRLSIGVGGDDDPDPGRSGMLDIDDIRLVLPGPVGHWTLDEGAGTIAHDSSGNGNDGTLMDNPDLDDPTWIAGVIGGAVEFHGTGVAGTGGDYFDCGSDASLDITSNISIALWIRPDADDPEGKGTAGGETAPLAKATSDWSWQVRYGWNTATPYMGFQFNTSPRAWAYVDRNLERFEWVHIACSHDGATLKCYLNGEETDSTPMGEIHSSADPVLIGSDGWRSDWTGGIDDVRIYDRPLSEAEILELAGN
ncbi:MAG: LamG domain-containing protein [Sedimentisphaerales bacterium]|nr:LamG domain-containing protein [Sedimentisphaerales bacterium]